MKTFFLWNVLLCVICLLLIHCSSTNPTSTDDSDQQTPSWELNYGTLVGSWVWGWLPEEGQEIPDIYSIHITFGKDQSVSQVWLSGSVFRSMSGDYAIWGPYIGFRGIYTSGGITKTSHAYTSFYVARAVKASLELSQIHSDYVIDILGTSSSPDSTIAEKLLSMSYLDFASTLKLFDQAHAENQIEHLGKPFKYNRTDY